MFHHFNDSVYRIVGLSRSSLSLNNNSYVFFLFFSFLSYVFSSWWRSVFVLFMPILSFREKKKNCRLSAAQLFPDYSFVTSETLLKSKHEIFSYGIYFSSNDNLWNFSFLFSFFQIVAELIYLMRNTFECRFQWLLINCFVALWLLLLSCLIDVPSSKFFPTIECNFMYEILFRWILVSYTVPPEKSKKKMYYFACENSEYLSVFFAKLVLFGGGWSKDEWWTKCFYLFS